MSSSLVRTQCKGFAATGTPCLKNARPGSGWCSFHGPDVERRLQVRQVGAYSDSLPEDLLAKYEMALADKDLLALRESIALIDARLHQLTDHIDIGESEKRWELLVEAAADFDRATARANMNAQHHALQLMLKLIKEGWNKHAVWADIIKTQEHRRKLVETERKRLDAMQATITVEKAMAIVYAIQEILTTRITDPVLLNQIATDINALMMVGAQEEYRGRSEDDED